MDELIKKKIIDLAKERLVEIAQQHIALNQRGNSADLTGKCPSCGSNKFSVSHKNIFCCFRCHDDSVKGAGGIDFLMKVRNMSYIEALESVAVQFGIDTTPPPSARIEAKKKVKDTIRRKDSTGNPVQSYCAKMLQESGLCFEDVQAKVFIRDENRTQTVSPTFFAGTINSRGDIDRSGDDAIIAYYDIEGMPIIYDQKDSKGRLLNKSKEYFRVRWQYPDEHRDKEGKPYKYKSPYGAPSQVYFPEKIREKYRSEEVIDRLFVQEGEKKAEKACKHGIPSIGISGIGNMGQDRRIPEDVIKLIERCKVKEVVFLLDSDWQDISTNIKITDSVEKRPLSFFYAVRSFKEYFTSLKNRQIYVEIYFGYVQKNQAGDKGVDDLLANTLAGREEELLQDINFAILEKDKIGKYIGIHKISTLTDHRIKEFWGLHHVDAFANIHKKILAELPEFKFGRYRWKFLPDGKLVSAQPIDDDEKFWDEIEKFDREGNSRKVYEFRYRRSHIFLQNRGFGRYRKSNGDFEFIHMHDNIVEIISTHDIFDYVYEFVMEHTNEQVQDMILRGGTQFLGPDKMSKLPYIYPNIITYDRNVQRLYFANYVWEISASSIHQVHYNNISHQIWSTSKKEHSALLLETPLLDVKKEESRISIKLTDTGKKCHFLKLLENASNFTWRKKPDDMDEKDMFSNQQHLLSKLCAIGYMLMDYKEASKARALIAMDGKLSEVGSSNGRTGKSLIAILFKYCVSTLPVNGKSIDFSDRFIWDGTTERTRIVAIDDVRAGFDFEQLFPNITSDWNVNPKSATPFILPFEKSPKIYITTNHAIKGDTGSFRDRQWVVAFSDYYSDERKPSDEFGQLFSDWDFDQWNLFWNMIATCIQLYMIYGYQASPAEKIEVRRLRQEMTEEFLDWAENYYSDESRLGVSVTRKELYDNFLEETNTPPKYCSPTLFKKRLKKFCEYKGYVINPHRYDPVTGLPAFFDSEGREQMDDKRAGVEFIAIGPLVVRDNKYSSSDNAIDYGNEEFAFD